MKTEGLLQGLQRTVRNAGPAGMPTVRNKHRDTLAALRREPRFADLDDLDDLLAGFCDRSASDRSTDHVPALLADLEARAGQVRSRVLLLAVNGLAVSAATVLGDVEFIPADAWPALPPLGPEIETLARVTVRGSLQAAMVSRARERAEDALAKLRLNVAAQGADDAQLHFYLDGQWAWADGEGGGWWRPPQQHLRLDISPEVLGPDRAHPVTHLPCPARTDAEKQAAFALMWLDHAARADDPLQRTVLPIFALEALLGDRSEKLKAKMLVFNRIMLGATVSGWWTSPAALHSFYDKIRSYAVHGSIPGQHADDRDISFLHADARAALGEYLTLCTREEFTKRSQLLRWLARHELAAEITAWLKQQDPTTWADWQPPTVDDLVADLLSLADDLSPQEAADFIRRVRETSGAH